MATSYYIVGGTYRFIVNLLKDSLPWDISTATFVNMFHMIDPTGVDHSFTPTINNPTQGQIQYITQITDLNIAGCWNIYCHVVDTINNIDDKTQLFPFEVNNN
jgi:hypothetical protein